MGRNTQQKSIPEGAEAEERRGCGGRCDESGSAGTDGRGSEGISL